MLLFQCLKTEREILSLSLTTLLIVCPLVFCGGFVDAIAGGGGLISISAYLMAGLPAHLVLGTNKLSACIGIAVSTARFAKSGYINARLAIFSVIGALTGSIIGSNLALYTPDHIFQIVMIVCLPIVAFFVFRKKSPLQNDKLRDIKTPLNKTTYIKVLVSMFMVGMYDGFYGPGTGTFMIILLTSFAGLGLNDAIGQAKIANFSSGLMSLIVFAVSGNVWWQLGLVCCIFSIFGNFVGAGLVMKDGYKVVRPIIAIVLVLLFIKVISELVM